MQTKEGTYQFHVTQELAEGLIEAKRNRFERLRDGSVIPHLAPIIDNFSASVIHSLGDAALSGTLSIPRRMQLVALDEMLRIHLEDSILSSEARTEAVALLLQVQDYLNK